MITRRNFIKNILVAGASFTVLPGAGRIWRAKRNIILEPKSKFILNPAWENAPYEIAFMFEDNGITPVTLDRRLDTPREIANRAFLREDRPIRLDEKGNYISECIINV